MILTTTETIKVLGYDLQVILGFLAGILATAIISFVFSVIREKRMLKLKVQLNTANELQELISNYFKNNNAIHYYFSRMDLNFYNKILQLSDFNKNEDFGESLTKKMIKWESNLEKYNNCLFAVTSHIELRQIVLSKFKHFHSRILGKHKTFIDLTLKIIKVNYQITNSINSTKLIDENTIDKYEKLLLV